MKVRRHGCAAAQAIAVAWLAVSIGRGDAIAFWHFDETPGSPIAHDSIGAKDGTLSGSADFFGGGVSGNAVSLTISGDGFVSMGDFFSFSTGDFTIVAWVRTNPGDQAWNLVFLAKHTYGWANGYVMGVNRAGPGGAYGQQNKAWFCVSAAAGGEAISSTDVNDGEWHQVVGLYHPGGQVRICVDGAGVEDSKPSCPIGIAEAPFMVGGHDFYGVPTGMFDGAVDEVQLYDQLLTDWQIQYLFQHPASSVTGRPGDLNCDGVVDFGDIDPFVLALSDPAGYEAAFPDCNILNGDCNGDGNVDFADIDPFVALLSG